MARKDLLKDLMGPAPERPEGEAASRASLDTARPRSNKGAIGAVSRSIADLKARSIVEIDPFEIDAGGVKDRLEHDEPTTPGCMESLRDYGQQVPVLVRPHPEKEGRFQIVYGRRRVLALRDLGQPVRALVRDLDDRALVVAQGQENTARRDLSFIEKANFARQMAEAGYDAQDHLRRAVDRQDGASAGCLRSPTALPVALIEEIGAAPSVGRDRWLHLADIYEASSPDVEDALTILNVSGAESSDARFEATLDWLTQRNTRAEEARKAAEPRPREIVRGDEGAASGRGRAEPRRGDAQAEIKGSRRLRRLACREPDRNPPRLACPARRTKSPERAVNRAVTKGGTSTGRTRKKPPETVIPESSL